MLQVLQKLGVSAILWSVLALMVLAIYWLRNHPTLAMILVFVAWYYGISVGKLEERLAPSLFSSKKDKIRA